jgi:hypothetical protein
MISPQLANEAIICCQLLSISYVRDGIFKHQYFEQKREQESETDCEHNKGSYNKVVSDKELILNSLERE